MSIAFTSLAYNDAQVTPSALTLPGYTMSVDTAPNQWAKQWTVSAISGTQTGVAAHTLAVPFTLTVQRPRSYKSLPPINPTTGLLRGAVPFNEHRLIGRRGLLPAANQVAVPGWIDVRMHLPAGAESYDVNNVAALFEMVKLALNKQLEEILTLTRTGSM